MEFSKHLGKGLWGIADKALPVVYGVAFVVLVIRVLPEEEFGNFILVQEIFLILSNLAAAFALHPLLKFASEDRPDHRHVIGSALLLNVAFVILASIAIVLFRAPLASVLNAPALSGLMVYVAWMLAANFIRNFTLILLQSRFQVRQVFWIDAAHFLGAPALILVFSWMHTFDSALDLLQINIISLSLSSIVGVVLARGLLHFTLKPDAGELRKMWDYGKYSFVTIVNYMLYVKADTFILSAYWGPVQVAVYNSVKVFIRIYDMVAQVAQMFVFPGVSRLSSKGDMASLTKLLEKAVAFTTVALLPVFVLFCFLSPTMIHIIYADRYADAVPLLQLFSLLCFLAPIIAVASNTLLGLGHARLSFFISLKSLVGSLIAYMILIPWLGAPGAAIGYAISFGLQAWWFTTASNRFVPLTWKGIWNRTADVRAFALGALKRGSR
jgi:lipopolysaccharide exporter